ncbi:hypothetical protein [Streptomyces sp. NPDC048248]|uniref:hypothetical protein n=1 Tax=Streptomyces sp. NPDC048248 TaxID=3365523 RepID=UPI00371E0EF0
MTQSGQGHDPQNSAAGPAREGIVLPANGEPWVPDQQAAPPAGQPWGQPWGPDQQAGPQTYGQAPAQGQAPAAQQAYGQTDPQGQASAPQQGYGQSQPPAYGQQQAPAPQQALPPQGEGYPQQPQGQPPLPPLPPSMPQQPPAQLPAAAGAEATAFMPPYGAQGGQGGALPPEGPAYGEAQQQGYGGHAAQQPQQQAYGQQPPQQYGQQQPQQPQQYGGPQQQEQYGGQHPQQPQPQQPQATSGQLVPASPQTGAPLPPAAGDAEATALIPPVGAQQGGPGVAPLPPEAPSRPETAGESTQMLRRVKPQDGGAGRQAQPMPQQSQPMPGAGPADSEATALIPPVGAGVPAPPPRAPYGIRPGAPGDRPTPAEFDGLFRNDSGTPGAAAPDATAQLPRFEDPGRPSYGGPGHGQFPPQGGGPDRQPYDDGHGAPRRRLAPAVIVGVVVLALAGAGLGVGWALSGGSDDETKKQSPGSSTEKTATKEPSAEPSADPAEAQAKGLDALLGDSNNSRSSVINAVNSIKTCDNLGKAAKDLRAAAGQRNALVQRLRQLPVDKIPDNAALTAALTTAWQSSASADNHYAAWAGQVAGKKGCHKGRARGTKQAAEGNVASGEATKAKQQAAKIWNPLAQKYSLTERRPEQL